MKPIIVKRSLRSIIITIAALAFGSIGKATDTPNIIVLLADDLGYGELGCQGNTEIPTPHIDSIAQNGVRFTNGYVTGPNCSPSRAGFLSGRIPTRFGYENNPIGHRNEDPNIGLPADEVTIAETLQDAGYTTGPIGKWHQGGTAAYHPFRHGFEEFFGFMHEGHYFVPPPYEGVTTMLRRKTIGRARLIISLAVLASGVSASRGGIDSFVLHIVAAASAWAAYAGVIYMIGSLGFGGRSGSRTFQQLVQTLGLASTPALLLFFGVIPTYGPIPVLIAYFWMFITTVHAVYPPLNIDRQSAIVTAAAGCLTLFTVSLVVPILLS